MRAASIPFFINAWARVLSPAFIIETGDTYSEDLRENCRSILSRPKNCSHILLACTHYPSIIKVMNVFVSAATKFVDPAEKIVDSLWP
jgi:glutamate racemase